MSMYSSFHHERKTSQYLFENLKIHLFHFQLEGHNRFIVPFLACGDLSAYDSDKTYSLGKRWFIKLKFESNLMIGFIVSSF